MLHCVVAIALMLSGLAVAARKKKFRQCAMVFMTAAVAMPVALIPYEWEPTRYVSAYMLSALLIAGAHAMTHDLKK